MQNKNKKMIHVFTSWLSKTWKITKNMFKNTSKSKLHFNANFNDFCLHFGSQNPSKKQIPLNIFSTFSSRHVKMPPRRPKTPPRHLQDASKALQEASKRCLRPPKTPPRRLWTAQRRLQAGLKQPKNATKLKDLKNPWIFSVFHSIPHFSCFQAFYGEEKGGPLWVSRLAVSMCL